MNKEVRDNTFGGAGWYIAGLHQDKTVKWAECHSRSAHVATHTHTAGVAGQVVDPRHRSLTAQTHTHIPSLCLPPPCTKVSHWTQNTQPVTYVDVGGEHFVSVCCELSFLAYLWLEVSITLVFCQVVTFFMSAQHPLNSWLFCLLVCNSSGLAVLNSFALWRTCFQATEHQLCTCVLPQSSLAVMHCNSFIPCEEIQDYMQHLPSATLSK